MSSERAELFSRIHELRSRRGRGWIEIADILEKEGYEENGKTLTANALRKRYAKWSQTDTRGTSPVASEPGPKQEESELDSGQLEMSRMDSPLKQLEEGAALPALSTENAIASGLANLVDLNRQLLEQIQRSQQTIERLGKKLEEQEKKTFHTGMDTEQPVTSRDLLELLKEVTGKQQMKYIEEEKEYEVSREEILQMLEEKVAEKVDAELKAMLSEQGSFSKGLSGLVDQRLTSLFSGNESVATSPHAGPGRGRKGKTHKKFSASLEEGLFERVKSLPGQFSGHLTIALLAYLSVMEKEKEC